MNQKHITTRELLVLRSHMLQAIREYFVEQRVMEADVPQLVARPDLEPTIELFATELIQPKETYQGFLIPSPEFHLKQLLAAGSGDIYWLGHCFRNQEPISNRHNPEFSMLEWYRLGMDYFDLMNDCQNLIKFVVHRFHQQQFLESSDYLHYHHLKINLAGDWERLSVAEAFTKFADIESEVLFDEQQLLDAAKNKGYTIDQTTTYDEVFYQILLQEIEPHLGKNKPTFLYDYPTSQAALAKIKASDDRVAERFELYIGGMELTNAFSELTNWQEQERRLNEQQQYRRDHHQSTWPVDDQFIAALKQGLPACAGISLGVDRLLMLLSNRESIMEVLQFPASRLFSIS